MIMSALAGNRLTSTLLVSWEDRNTDVGVGRNPMPVIRDGVALDVLQELGEEEDHPVHPGVAEAAGHVGGGPGAVGQDPQREDRLGRRRLDADEQAEQGHAGDERADRDGRGPAGGPGFDQAEHHRGHPGRGGHGAGQVEPAVAALGLDQHGAADERARPGRWGR